jgi:predicted dehydrogenase
MTRNRIRLGIIGTGGAVRTIHWPVLKSLSAEVRIAAVASGRPQNAKAFARLVGAAQVYEDYRAMLADPEIDAILTAVPIMLNARVLIDCVRCGKHVLAEKPIAATPIEARQVLKECRKSRAVIGIAENFRYREDVIVAKRLIAKGMIGELSAFQVNVKFDMGARHQKRWTRTLWRQDAQHPGGFLLDAGVHHVAALRDVLGEVTGAFAQKLDRCFTVPGADTLLAQLALENGAIGHYFACYAAKTQKETTFELLAYGTRGSIEVLDGRVYCACGPQAPPHAFVAKQFDRGYRRLWQNFCSAIRGEEEIVSTPEKAYGDVLLISAALQSAQTGRNVSIRSHFC